MQDKTDFIDDLETIYNALDHDLALTAFDTVKAMRARSTQRKSCLGGAAVPTSSPCADQRGHLCLESHRTHVQRIPEAAKTTEQFNKIDTAEKIICIKVMEIRESRHPRAWRSGG